MPAVWVEPARSRPLPAMNLPPASQKKVLTTVASHRLNQDINIMGRSSDRPEPWSEDTAGDPARGEGKRQPKARALPLFHESAGCQRPERGLTTRESFGQKKLSGTVVESEEVVLVAQFGVPGLGRMAVQTGVPARCEKAQ